MPMRCLKSMINFDPGNPDTGQEVLESCIAMLLNPRVWLWATAITLACSGIGMLIGWFKGRWMPGLVWGTALGPIGWVVVAMQKSSLNRCPGCATPNRNGGYACRECGMNLTGLQKQRVG